MPFINSVVLFLALTFAVAVPILGGYGLTEHNSAWLLIALACGAIAAALVAAHVKLLGRRDVHEH